MTMKIGVAGCGYWGSKHLRVVDELPEAELAAICDPNAAQLKRAGARYGGALLTRDFDELLAAPVEAVIVATPANTHYELVRRALLAGKHVLVEKPMAAGTAQALELVRLAEERGLTLMVGSTFLYSSPVRFLRTVVQRGDLGRPLYVHSARLNFGLLRQDVDVLWDLAPHDLAIIMYVLGRSPVAIGARTVNCTDAGLPEVAHADLRFPDDLLAHIEVSWLHPAKVRRLTLVGSEGMLVYDDVAAGETIRIYDRKITPRAARNGTPPPVDYSFGDVRIPHLPEVEPLREQCSHFVRCIRTGERPLSDGRHGLEVVRILEALGRSAAAGGVMEPLAQLAIEPSGAPEAPRANGSSQQKRRPVRVAEDIELQLGSAV